eukprot:SAG31_NODE_12142_length_964_cov_1.971098_2_plen_50_part_01
MGPPPPTFRGAFGGYLYPVLLTAYRKPVAHSSPAGQSKILDFLGQGPPAP